MRVNRNRPKQVEMHEAGVESGAPSKRPDPEGSRQPASAIAASAMGIRAAQSVAPKILNDPAISQ